MISNEKEPASRTQHATASRPGHNNGEAASAPCSPTPQKTPSGAELSAGLSWSNLSVNVHQASAVAASAGTINASVGAASSPFPTMLAIATSGTNRRGSQQVAAQGDVISSGGGMNCNWAGALPYVAVIDAETSKMWVPASSIVPTSAFARTDHHPSVCRLFLSGSCRQGSRCFQAHIMREVVEVGRKKLLANPPCCLLHDTQRRTQRSEGKKQRRKLRQRRKAMEEADQQQQQPSASAHETRSLEASSSLLISSSSVLPSAVPPAPPAPSASIEALPTQTRTSSEEDSPGRDGVLTDSTAAVVYLPGALPSSTGRTDTPPVSDASLQSSPDVGASPTPPPPTIPLVCLRGAVASTSPASYVRCSSSSSNEAAQQQPSSNIAPNRRTTGAPVSTLVSGGGPASSPSLLVSPIPLGFTVVIDRTLTVPLSSFAFTQGLLLLYEIHGSLQVECSSSQLCRSHAGESSASKRHDASLRPSMCRFGEECKFLHMCREVSEEWRVLSHSKSQLLLKPNTNT